MTVRVSTKFKELLLGGTSFSEIFNGGRIDLFSGGPPDSADYPEQGTLLASVTNLGQAWTPNGGPGGLNFTLNGVWATNDPAQAWQLVAAAAGVAGWFRLYGPALDTGEYSFSSPRIDGTVSASGTADMHLPNTTFTIGYTLPFQQFLFSFPPILGA
jgi:hypothetical protein